MSRTEKDMPIDVLRRRAPWRFERGGYPGAWGNAWCRIGRDTTLWWRGERSRVNRQLHVGEQPEPTRTRSQVKFHVW